MKLQEEGNKDLGIYLFSFFFHVENNVGVNCQTCFKVNVILILVAFKNILEQNIHMS